MTEYIKVEDIISKNVDSYSKIVAEVGNKEIGDTAESTDATKMKVQCCRCRPDWFVVDGLGITCSGLTYILILFGEFVVIGGKAEICFYACIWKPFCFFRSVSFHVCTLQFHTFRTNIACNFLWPGCRIYITLLLSI